ncbi:MAG: DUF4234 domain-containing protein [Oscillospiraceae bacterium]|nr:DUF4234 domain-containing protein [Oscillospiraceae bacterium]
MKCYYCGADVIEGELFCRYCGTRQDRAPEGPPAVEETVPEQETIPEKEPEKPLFELTVPPQPAWQPEPWSQPAPAPQPASRTAPEGRYVPYGAPARNAAKRGPMLQLPAERSLGMMVFLGILTLGIYPLVIWCRMVTELNIAASRYDGERTMSYLGMVLLTPLTLGVYPFVWFHGFCRRVGAELKRRGINCEFGAKTFWLWNVLGALILVGPFIFTHRLTRAMNLLNRDFNVKG